jgi:hypothetical protein
MKIKFLAGSCQRAWGAMFSGSLEETLLVFLYPTAARRTFHTFCCPPLRMVALDENGAARFDQVIQPGQFVRLPACKIVLECEPRSDYRPHVESILTVAHECRFPQSGAWEAGSGLDALLFALFAQAMADLRRVRCASPEGVDREVLRQRFSLWERGRFASSAGFILDFSGLYNLPEGALEISRDLVETENPFLHELYAAAIGGMPWRNVFPGICLRCGQKARWKAALSAPPDTPPEIAWRYQRPENTVPLCRACTMTLRFLSEPILRIDLAWGLWGARFEALWRWHKALTRGNLPAWDKLAHPLWPADYGGESWENGSGALEHATPRMPNGVTRTARHDQVFWRGLSVKGVRKRDLTDTYLQALVQPDPQKAQI